MSMGKNLLLCLIALGVSTIALAEPLARPNILILMAEDLSDRIGAFGDEVAHTPNIDQLAQTGVRYPNTFTTAGVCAPSRAAHITGMHQASFGGQHMRTSRGPLGKYKAVPPEQVKAYPELLRHSGYFTFTESKLDYQFSGTLSGSGPFTIWDEEGGDGFAGWRVRDNGQPFYGLINYGVTHESGVFPPLGTWPNSVMHFIMQAVRYYKLPDAPDIPATDPRKIVVPPYYPDTPTVRADMARHYSNIAIMDWQIGEVLRALQEDGLADSTIVIWTTDHGDGLPRGKRELFDTGIKVPMVIHWPQAYRPVDAAPGSLDTRLVSLIDLAPTVLRLAGVPVPDYLQGQDIVTDEPRQYIFAARDRIDEVPDRQRAVRDGRYKYIRSWYPEQGGGHPLEYRDNINMVREMRELYNAGKLNSQQSQWFEAPGKERLFDTEEDPWELNDLAGDPAHAQILNRMRSTYEEFQSRVPDWSERSEEAMLATFRPDGEAPVTPPPTLLAKGGKLRMTAPANASIGYRVNEGRWQLYSEPVKMPTGATIEARAVRYGWEESDIASLKLP